MMRLGRGCRKIKPNKKTVAVSSWKNSNMRNRQRQKKQGVAAPVADQQFVAVHETAIEVGQVRGAPITEQLKDMAMQYFKKPLQRDHGGQLTQQVAEALCTSDRTVQ